MLKMKFHNFSFLFIRKRCLNIQYAKYTYITYLKIYVRSVHTIATKRFWIYYKLINLIVLNKSAE